MTANISSLEEVIESLHTAAKLLSAAEKQWPEALRTEGAAIPEFAELKELLPCAMHEAASNLAFLLQDVEALLARIRVRRKYASFNTHQFNRIVQEGWSLQLLQDLQRQRPGASLLEMSNMMKQIGEEWERLPRAMHAQHSA